MHNEPIRAVFLFVRFANETQNEKNDHTVVVSASSQQHRPLFGLLHIIKPHY